MRRTPARAHHRPSAPASGASPVQTRVQTRATPGEWSERPGFARRDPRIDPVLSSGVFGSVRSVCCVGWLVGR